MNGKAEEKAFRYCVYSYGGGEPSRGNVSCFRLRLDGGVWRYHYEIRDVDRTGMVSERWGSVGELLIAVPRYRESEMSEVLV